MCILTNPNSISARLRGGAKKRKKKNYTTPKKIKHKHRKVKLAVLKYYKVGLLVTKNRFELPVLQVDDNGKINRLRRECPAEECGAGVFMAAHFDRQVGPQLINLDFIIFYLFILHRVLVLRAVNGE